MPAVGLVMILIALWLIIRVAAGGLPKQLIAGFKTG